MLSLVSCSGYEGEEQVWRSSATEPPEATGVAEGIKTRGAGEDRGAEVAVGDRDSFHNTWMLREAGESGSGASPSLQPRGKGARRSQRLKKLHAVTEGFGAAREVANGVGGPQD